MIEDLINNLSSPSKLNLLITFADLTKFGVISKEKKDIEIFEMLNKTFEQIGKYVTDSKGKIIKYIGDAALIVHSIEYLDNAILTLYDMKKNIDNKLKNDGLPNRLSIRSHIGEAFVGFIGAHNDKHVDIIGEEVNNAAMISSNIPKDFNENFIISEKTFNALSDNTKKLFCENVSTIYYAFNKKTFK